MFARRCGAEDSFMLGVIKELSDVIGSGNAELADLQADADGVTLWRLGMGRSDQVCKDNCNLLYPYVEAVNACQLPQNPY